METSSNDKPSKCPECGSKLSKALETRQRVFHGITFILRVRQCRHCGFQFKTKQLPEVMCEDIPLPHRTRHTPSEEEMQQEKKEAAEKLPIPDIGGIDERAEPDLPIAPKKQPRRKKVKTDIIFPEIDENT